MCMAEKITYSESGEEIKKYTVCQEFKRVLHLVMDGEASKEEEKFFLEHISESTDCLKYFDEEKDFRKFFKTSCTCVSIDKEMIQKIKAKLATFQA